MKQSRKTLEAIVSIAVVAVFFAAMVLSKHHHRDLSRLAVIVGAALLMSGAVFNRPKHRSRKFRIQTILIAAISTAALVTVHQVLFHIF